MQQNVIDVPLCGFYFANIFFAFVLNMYNLYKTKK